VFFFEWMRLQMIALLPHVAAFFYQKQRISPFTILHSQIFSSRTHNPHVESFFYPFFPSSCVYELRLSSHLARSLSLSLYPKYLEILIRASNFTDCLRAWEREINWWDKKWIFSCSLRMKIFVEWIAPVAIKFQALHECFPTMSFALECV
jgi:hypothetical protein